MYERAEIDAVLGNLPISPVRGQVVYLMADDDESQSVYDLAVAPVLAKQELHDRIIGHRFNSDSDLRDVRERLLTPELVIVDADPGNADLMYVLGLCHGLGRCPLVLLRDGRELPFSLCQLRSVQYEGTPVGINALREPLSRAVRAFLCGARKGHL